MNWTYIVVDEAHKLKNEDSLISQNIRTFPAKFRLIITGTPLQNNLRELWALLNYLMPSLFEDAEEFNSWFDVKQGHEEKSIISQLHRILRPFMLRRVKADVDKEIPPKKEVYIGAGLSPMQKKWYTDVLMKDIQVLYTYTHTHTRTYTPGGQRWAGQPHGAAEHHDAAPQGLQPPIPLYTILSIL